MWPGRSSPGVDAICGSNLLLVLSITSERFSPLGTPFFPPPQKPTVPNSNATRNQVDDEPPSGRTTSKSLLFMYLILF